MRVAAMAEVQHHGIIGEDCHPPKLLTRRVGLDDVVILGRSDRPAKPLVVLHLVQGKACLSFVLSATLLRSIGHAAGIGPEDDRLRMRDIALFVIDDRLAQAGHELGSQVQGFTPLPHPQHTLVIRGKLLDDFLICRRLVGLHPCLRVDRVLDDRQFPLVEQQLAKLCRRPYLLLNTPMWCKPLRQPVADPSHNLVEPQGIVRVDPHAHKVGLGDLRDAARLDLSTTLLPKCELRPEPFDVQQRGLVVLLIVGQQLLTCGNRRVMIVHVALVPAEIHRLECFVRQGQIIMPVALPGRRIVKVLPQALTVQP